MAAPGPVTQSPLKLVCPDGTEYQLAGIRLRIGRAADNDISFPRDQMISSNHCIINNGVLLDERSYNGTMINNERVPHQTKVLLRVDDVIAIGATRLLVKSASEPPAELPPPSPEEIERSQSSWRQALSPARSPVVSQSPSPESAASPTMVFGHRPERQSALGAKQVQANLLAHAGAPAPVVAVVAEPAREPPLKEEQAAAEPSVAAPFVAPEEVAIAKTVVVDDLEEQEDGGNSETLLNSVAITATDAREQHFLRLKSAAEAVTAAEEEKKREMRQKDPNYALRVVLGSTLRPLLRRGSADYEDSDGSAALERVVPLVADFAMEPLLFIRLPDGRQMQLNDNNYEMGRLNTTMISVPNDNMISGRHCRINNCWLQDIGSTNGTLLNNRLLKPHQPERLRVGDVFQIGMTDIPVLSISQLDNQDYLLEGSVGSAGSSVSSAMDSISAAAAAGMSEMTVNLGSMGGSAVMAGGDSRDPKLGLKLVIGVNGERQVLLPEEAVINIGREKSMDVCIPEDKMLSSRHCQVRGGGMSQPSVILDRGSTNGTTVDGVPLTPHQPHVLLAGNVIRVGENRILVAHAVPEELRGAGAMPNGQAPDRILMPMAGHVISPMPPSTQVAVLEGSGVVDVGGGGGGMMYDGPQHYHTDSGRKGMFLVDDASDDNAHNRRRFSQARQRRLHKMKSGARSKLLQNKIFSLEYQLLYGDTQKDRELAIIRQQLHEQQQKTKMYEQLLLKPQQQQASSSPSAKSGIAQGRGSQLEAPVLDEAERQNTLCLGGSGPMTLESISTAQVLQILQRLPEIMHRNEALQEARMTLLEQLKLDVESKGPEGAAEAATASIATDEQVAMLTAERERLRTALRELEAEKSVIETTKADAHASEFAVVSAELQESRGQLQEAQRLFDRQLLELKTRNSELEARNTDLASQAAQDSERLQSELKSLSSQQAQEAQAKAVPTSHIAGDDSTCSACSCRFHVFNRLHRSLSRPGVALCAACLSVTDA